MSFLLYKVVFDSTPDYQYDVGGTFFTTSIQAHPKSGKPRVDINSDQLSPEGRLGSVKEVLEGVKRNGGLEVTLQRWWSVEDAAAEWQSAATRKAPLMLRVDVVKRWENEAVPPAVPVVEVTDIQKTGAILGRLTIGRASIWTWWHTRQGITLLLDAKDISLILAF